MTSEVQSPLHVLLIVRADCRRLLPRLRTKFKRSAIVVDRRVADRRAVQEPVAAERRHGRDRRRPLMEPEERLWAEGGYRIVYRVENSSVEDSPRQ